MPPSRSPLLALALLIGSCALLTLGCSGQTKVDLGVEQMADAPIPDRSGATAIWTGMEVIYWGGRTGVKVGTDHADGAAYNPTTDTWRTIAPAPLEARSRHSAAWSGSEMVIWGGTNDRHTDGSTWFTDGAAYNVATDTWRLLPKPDADLLESVPAPFMASSPAVIVGDRLFVPATNSVMSLDLVTGNWKQIEIEVPSFDTTYFSSSFTVYDEQLYLTARVSPADPPIMVIEGDDLVIATLDPATAEVLDVDLVVDAGPAASLVSTSRGLTLLTHHDGELSVQIRQPAGWEAIAAHDLESFGSGDMATPPWVVEAGDWVVGVDVNRLNLIDRDSLEAAYAPDRAGLSCALGPSTIWTGTYIVAWNGSACFASNEDGSSIPIASGVVMTLPEPAQRQATD